GTTQMIDFHTHPVLIQELAKKYPDYERSSREVFQIGNNFQPLETFFLQMDVAGIDRAVLLPIDCRRARKLGVSSNEQVDELCAANSAGAMSSSFVGAAGEALPKAQLYPRALRMAVGVGRDRDGVEVSQRLSRHLVPLLRQPERIL